MPNWNGLMEMKLLMTLDAESIAEEGRTVKESVRRVGEIIM
jgi:hypothetical protein